MSSPDVMPTQAAINNPFTDDQAFSVTFHPAMYPWIVEVLAQHGCGLTPVPWPSDPTVPEYLATLGPDAALEASHARMRRA